MILTLQTNSFACYGGIPTYNRLICRVLNEFNWGGGTCVLVAMDDREDVDREAVLMPNLRLAGFGGNRIRFVIAALRAVVSNPVEMLLAGHVNYAPVCLFLKWLRPSMRFGVSIHGCEVWDRLSFLRRLALRRADFVLSVSDYTKQQAVRNNGLQKDRIIVLPNALEWTTNEVSSSTKVRPLPQGIKLLSVGRLDANERRKGFDTVIESLPAVAQRVPDVQYIIIGSGTDLERHRQLAREVGVADRVHLLANVDDDTLRYYHESSDVFVMPSTQEGFGFVYLEAMLYGKPVVAANYGGAPEVVEDGVTGCLVEYGNIRQLTETLIDICFDLDKRQRLGAAGYQRLQKRFTFEHFNRRLKDIFMHQLSSQVFEPGDKRQITNTAQSLH